jgi:hypothetical protein
VMQQAARSWNRYGLCSSSSKGYCDTSGVVCVTTPLGCNGAWTVGC